jgi:hypothetical protein
LAKHTTGAEVAAPITARRETEPAVFPLLKGGRLIDIIASITDIAYT